MKVVKAAEKTTVICKKLSELKHGEVFRFPNFSFEEAITGQNESTFYMVVNKQPAQSERVSIMSLDGKSIIERDADRLVIPHDAQVVVSPN